MLKDLLVHVDSTDVAEKRLRIAIELAGRYGAHLTGLYAETTTLGFGRRDPDLVVKAVARARELFETKVSAAQVSGAWWAVEAGDDAELATWTVQCCRYVDLAIFGGPAGEGDRLPADLVEEVALESGRPLLVIPPRVPVAHVGERVIVAWTGNRSSARAVNDALPLLARAREVTVVSIQLPGAETAGPLPPLDVAAHLAAHGVKARYERFILGELGPVDHVLNRAMDLGADLIVMGAHGGGRGLARSRHEDHTAEILRSMTAPLLLAH